MSSSTIRKAIGVVKDQTSISIAKVAGNVAPDLEVLIVKATGHDKEPAEEKYIREILHRISQSRGYVGACVYNISKRLSKTHDWVVALKALMLVHRLLADGDPVFCQEIMYASRKGTRVLNMSDFRVEALSNYWDHSAFVKNYSLYLDQKLEFIAFERNLSGVIDKPRLFEDEPSYGISHKSRSYGDLYESVTRNDRRETKVATTPVKEMKPDRLLERLNKLVRVIDRALSCRPAGTAKSNKMVLVALYLVLRESFRVYADICEALGVLLDRFPEMEYANCVKTFDQYVKAAKTIDELVDFYTWSKDLGAARSSEFPEVQRVTDKILATLERGLREKKNKLNKNAEISLIENGPFIPTDTTKDLLDMKDDTAPPANEANTLALALFSGPTTVATKGSWEVFSGPEKSSDWELALVESATNLSKQNSSVTGVTGGLDLVTLNGIYNNQGAVTQQQVSGTYANMGRTATPVLKADPQDPFAASLMVPPPQYVQLADLEKRKIQEHVWQQYGQAPAGKINAGVANFNGMGQQAGYSYAHY